MTALAVLVLVGCQITVPVDPVTPTTTTTTTTTSTTTTTLPPNPSGRWCDCDLSGPVVQPPYTAAELNTHSQECPVFQGKDIRFSVTRKDASTRWYISSPFKNAIVNNTDGTVTIKCVTDRGCSFHVTGWSYQVLDVTKQTFGDTFKYKGTVLVYAECRKLAVTNPTPAGK